MAKMKKTAKIIKWTISIILVVLLLVVIGFSLFFPTDRARQLAIEKGSEKLNRKVNIASAKVSFWGGLGVKLEDVTISSPEGFTDSLLLRAENIDVKLELFSLMFGEYKIAKLIVNNPEIWLVKTGDGQSNYEFESLQDEIPIEITENLTPEVIAAAATVTFDNLEINNGIVHYINSMDQDNFEFKGLNLSTSLEQTEENVYYSRGEFAIDTVDFNKDKILPNLYIASEYDIVYDITDDNLELSDTKLYLNELELLINGQVEDILNEISARINIKTDPVDIQNILTLIPENEKKHLIESTIDGQISFDLNSEYINSEFSYYGTAKLNKVNYKHEKCPGILKLKSAVLDFKNDNLRLNIIDGNFDEKPVQGHLVIDDFENPKVNAELSGMTNLSYLNPLFSDGTQSPLSGFSDFHIKLFGSLDSLSELDISGTLTVKEGKYSSTTIIPEEIESFDMDLYFDNELIMVNNFSAQTVSGNLNFKGRLKNIIQYYIADTLSQTKIVPTVDGNLVGKVDLFMINSLLPPQGNPQISGELDIDFNITGPLNDIEKFEPRGTINIQNASYSDELLPEPVNNLDAQFVVSPDTIEVNRLSVQFESSDLTFSGDLIRPFPYLLPIKDLDRSKYKKPIFLFSLTSRFFNADKLFPEAVPGVDDTSDVVIDSISALILPDIDGSGTFYVDSLIYSKINFEKINGKIKIYDRKIECYDVYGDVYSGKVSGNTIIDLNNFSQPSYNGSFKATDIEVNDFMSRFTPMTGHLFGKINIEGNYSAVGWDPQQFRNSLSMTSSSEINRGRLVTSGDVFSKMNNLASKLNTSFDKEQTIRNLTGNIFVKEGKVILENMTTKFGSFGDVSLEGFYSFDNNISYNGSILLNRDMTKKLLSNKSLLGDLTQVFKENSINRIKLPLSFGGTIERPEFNIDFSAIAKAAGGNIINDLGHFFK
jgi:hypothetical protein